MYPVGSEEGSVTAVAGRRVTISVTTRRVVAAILALQVALLAVVGIEYVGPQLPILRGGLAFLYLSLVPGFLLLRLVGISPRSRAEMIVYTVGVSLISLMAFGTIINFGLRAGGITQPLSELPVVLSISAIVLGLTGLYATRVEEEPIAIDLDLATSPLALGLTLLPVLGIYGGLVLTRFSNNIPLLVLYAAIALLPALVLLDVLPDRLFAYAIWTASLALLLQNTLTGQFLAWGDQPKEAALALDVLRRGFWSPELAPAFGAKYSMLRIVILHPIYALFTDLQLVWVFKLAHPLLFSVTPVALYEAYRRNTSNGVAFLSAYLFISLFSFFIALSRNTRTATALLFLAMLALLVADDHLDDVYRKLLAIVFVAGIVVSHYGVSYMVMAAIAAAFPLIWIFDRLANRPADESTLTSGSFAVLYLSMLFAWYIFASPGSKAFSLVVNFGNTFFDTLADQFLADPGATSASTRYLTENFVSVTLEAIKLYNVLIGAVIVVGLGITLLRLYRDEQSVQFGTEYLAYASLFLGVFAITFLPVERFNTARTYPTTLLFFAPFFVIGVREILTLGQYVPKLERSTINRVAAVLVVGYFLLNVGFISATVTHEYSTNALVEKDRIMDEGHPAETTYFYKQYPTVQSVSGTAFLHANAANNTTRYTNGWPGIMRGAVGYTDYNEEPPERPHFNGVRMTRSMLNESGGLGPGYLYQNTYTDERWGNTIRYPTGHFGFQWERTSDVNDNWAQKNRVYDNGGSSIYK